MKILSHISYFFYIGLNWNWRIAFYLLLDELKGEKKYGIDTTGADELKKLKRRGIDISHATIYMPASYTLLEKIFDTLDPLHRKHIVDIGCGKGRALCVAAYKGYTKVTGIDISEELCADATENLEKARQQFISLQFTVITKNAMAYDIPPDVDCIFFFNPFDEEVMSTVLKHIMQSLQLYPRKISIAYINPLYKQIFLDKGFIEIFYYKQMKYLEFSILEWQKKRPGSLIIQ